MFAGEVHFHGFRRLAIKAGKSPADVAAEVGLITTSVTYYYRKKDDLAAACFMRGIDIFTDLAREAASVSGARARLAKFLELFFEMAAKIRLKEAAPIVAFSEMRALNEPLRSGRFLPDQPQD